MTREAKVKKFKLAFLKPKHPDKKALDEKVSMDKLVTSLKKPSDEDDKKKRLLSAAATRFFAMDNDGQPLNPEHAVYFEKLLPYKLIKHWNEDQEFAMWRDHVGNPQTIGKAAKIIIDDAKKNGNQLSLDFVKEFTQRFENYKFAMDALYDAAPDLMLQEALKKLKETPESPPKINSDRLQGKLVYTYFSEGKLDKINPLYLRSVSAEDAAELANKDPKAYSRVFLENVDTYNRVQALKNPQVREALAKDTVLWAKLLKDVSMLPFLDKAQGKVDTSGSIKEQEQSLAKSVFEEMLSEGNALNLTYYTNNFTTPSDALGASPDELEKLVATKREELLKLGYTDVPDQPAAQCDVLVSMLKSVIEAALGPNATAKCKSIVIPEMVLTVPLSKLPGPNKQPGKGGLLPLDFGGNIYLDDATAPNGQVFFTGQGIESPDAHTYLEVDGVLYDAVLGTSGQDVLDAVAEKFVQWQTDWVTVADRNVKVKVARGDKGHWIVEESGLVAAKNSQGFKTGYRLTDNIGKYAAFVGEKKVTFSDT